MTSTLIDITWYIYILYTYNYIYTWGPYFGSLKAAQKAVSFFGPRKLTDQQWHHAFSSILRRAKMERILDCPDNALSQHGVTTPAGPITKTEKGCIFKVMGASLHNTWSFLFWARKSLTKIQRHRPSLPQAPHHKAMACEVPAMQLRQLRQKQEDFHQECSCSQQLCQIRLKQEDFHQKSSKNNPGATHTHWKHNIGNAHPKEAEGPKALVQTSLMNSTMFDNIAFKTKQEHDYAVGLLWMAVCNVPFCSL